MKAKRTQLWGLGSVLLLTAVLLTAMIWLWSAFALQTASRAEADFDRIPDEQIPAHLRRLTQTGDAALPALCAGLASPRPAVADAACETLLEEMARWELLPAAPVSNKLSRLSELLAQHSADPRHPARWRLADLAERVLAWPAVGLPDMPQIAANCQRVLEAAVAEPPQPRLLAVREASPLRSAPVEGIATAATDPLGPSADAALFHQPAPEISDRQHLSLPPPELLPTDVPAPKPISAANDAKASQEQTPPVTTISTPNVAIRIRAPSAPLDQLNTIPLAELLHSTDDAVSQSARLELARRGHPPVELYLLERLTHADAIERSRAAGSLPAMPQMDARPWLLHLSRDSSADVRLVALSLMATSGESQMQRRVKEMAQTDSDARVRDQAQRAAR